METNIKEMSRDDFDRVCRVAQDLIRKTEEVVVGKHTEIVLLVTALLAGGHVLIEDVPGVGKTTLASTLSRAAGLDFRRAQFTPDVMASDITGFNIYNRTTEKFEFQKGLVMTNILLADEINRASPKTQSALLEAMEETRVTVDGKTYDYNYSVNARIVTLKGATGKSFSFGVIAMDSFHMICDESLVGESAPDFDSNSLTRRMVFLSRKK